MNFEEATKHYTKEYALLPEEYKKLYEETCEKEKRIDTIGYWIRLKYRMRVQDAGYYIVARQLRKQGIPIEIARLILL